MHMCRKPDERLVSEWALGWRQDRGQIEPRCGRFAVPPEVIVADKKPRRYRLDMTQLLERAFAEASQLPAAEQDAVASFLLAELKSEQQWSKSFALSQDQLSALADEALREFETGETQPLDVE